MTWTMLKTWTSRPRASITWPKLNHVTSSYSVFSPNTNTPGDDSHNRHRNPLCREFNSASLAGPTAVLIKVQNILCHLSLPVYIIAPACHSCDCQCVIVQHKPTFLLLPSRRASHSQWVELALIAGNKSRDLAQYPQKVSDAILSFHHSEYLTNVGFSMPVWFINKRPNTCVAFFCVWRWWTNDEVLLLLVFVTHAHTPRFLLLHLLALLQESGGAGGWGWGCEEANLPFRIPLMIKNLSLIEEVAFPATSQSYLLQNFEWMAFFFFSLLQGVTRADCRTAAVPIDLATHSLRRLTDCLSHTLNAGYLWQVNNSPPCLSLCCVVNYALVRKQQTKLQNVKHKPGMLQNVTTETRRDLMRATECTCRVFSHVHPPFSTNLSTVISLTPCLQPTRVQHYFEWESLINEKIWITDVWAKVCFVHEFHGL